MEAEAALLGQEELAAELRAALADAERRCAPPSPPAKGDQAVQVCTILEVIIQCPMHGFLCAYMASFACFLEQKPHILN